MGYNTFSSWGGSINLIKSGNTQYTCPVSASSMIPTLLIRKETFSSLSDVDAHS